MGCQERHSDERRKSQFFLFDAGATLPSVTSLGTGSTAEGYKWSGTGFLYEWYKERGISFDQVYAWEPSKVCLYVCC